MTGKTIKLGNGATHTIPAEILEKAQAFSQLTLEATLEKAPRKPGGGRFYMYAVTGSPEALAAYKETQSAIKVEGSKTGTALVEDPITGSLYHVMPTSSLGRKIKLQWTSGDPVKNPLGRFVADDLDKALAHDQKVEEYLAEKEADMLIQRRFGAVRQPGTRGTNQGFATEQMTAEELAASLESEAAKA